MKLNPKKHPNGKGFILTFRHPLLKKVVTRGLGTADETTCQSIIIDLESLFSTPALLQGPPYKTELMMYERRAVEVALGPNVAREVFDGADNRPALTADELSRLVQASEVLHTPAVDYKLRRLQMIATVNGGDPSTDEALAISERRISEKRFEEAAALQNFTPQAQRRLQEQNIELLKRLKVITVELESRRAENERLGRQHNVDVKVTLGRAVESWKPIYQQGRKADTVKTSFAYVEKFIDFLPDKERAKLGGIRARDLDRWIESLRGIDEDGDYTRELSPLTKRNHRNAVSAFFKWAVSNFDLVENPVSKTLAIAGVQKIPEQIIAIDRVADLNSLIKLLDAAPYWQAWVAKT